MTRRGRRRGNQGISAEDRRLILWLAILDRVARPIITWAGAILLAYVSVYLPIRETAGTKTILALFYNLALKADLGPRISYALNLGLILLLLWQRRSLKRGIDREHRRVVELETQLDPKRSTSGLKG